MARAMLDLRIGCRVECTWNSAILPRGTRGTVLGYADPGYNERSGRWVIAFDIGAQEPFTVAWAPEFIHALRNVTPLEWLAEQAE